MLNIVYPLSLSWGGVANKKDFMECKSDYGYFNLFVLFVNMFTHKILKVLPGKGYSHVVEYLM